MLVSVFGCLVVVGIVVVVVFYFGLDFYGIGEYIGFSKIWLLLFGVFWWCWWLVLDYKVV